MVYILFLLVPCLALGACAYLNQPKFGSHPEGARLERVKHSPNQTDGVFHNQIPTPMFSDDSSMVSALASFLFSKKDRPRPSIPLPAVKTDLKALDTGRDTVVWLGHSSFFVILGGRRILIDPVFSDNAAPIPFANRAFAGTSIYGPEDMPAIDYLLITHDHWDHLDYPSIIALRPKVGRAVCGLGVGAHLEPWGYGKDMLIEEDWNTELALGPGLTLHVLPARHFSGRLMTRNRTLWVGFALETPERRLFFSGDTGYGPHFKEIGSRFKGFDLVSLDNGQYDKRWAYIHMTPEEAAQAAEELGARAVIPGHAGRFCISTHSWDDPFIRLSAASKDRSYRLLTPLIGVPVFPDDERQTFAPWWEGIN